MKTSNYRSRRSRRRILRIRSIAAVLIPLMVIGPERVLALHNDAMAHRAMSEALSAAAIAQAGGDQSLTYTYDDNGNLIRRDDGSRADVYRYDAENRLRGMDDLPDLDPATIPVPQVDYAYDADGIRREKTDYEHGGLLTTYLTDKNRDFAQVLVETKDPSGAAETITKYSYGDDLISQDRAGTLSYYHYDGQLSVRQLSDAPLNPVANLAKITDTYTFDAFGEQDLTASTTDDGEETANNYLYTGEQYDPSVGFYYLRARYYDQSNGRFTSRDTFEGLFEDPTSLHKYLYVGADPVDNVDPSGQYGFTLQGLQISIVIGSVLIGLVVGAIIGGPKGGAIGAVAGLVIGLFVAAVFAEALFAFAIAMWGTLLATFGAALFPASQFLNGPLGRVALRRLNQAAQASTNTIRLWTRISTTPSTQRVLNTATDVNLANAGARASRNLYRFDIPSQVLSELRAVGLVAKELVQETVGPSGTAYTFLPEAVGYITQWMSKVSG